MGGVEEVEVKQLTFGGALEKFVFVDEGERAEVKEEAGARQGSDEERAVDTAAAGIDDEEMWKGRLRWRVSKRKRMDGDKDGTGREEKGEEEGQKVQNKDKMRRRRRGTTSTCSPLTTVATFTPPAPLPGPPYPIGAKIPPPSPLKDILIPSLVLVFIGTNPGLLTAFTGHTYSSPTNSFWKLLHACKLTPTCRNTPLEPTEDRSMPGRFLLGNTNIVERATRSQGDLTKEEMVLGAGRCVAKIARWRPEAVCVVGKGVWESFVGWVRRETKAGRRSGVVGDVAGGCGKGFQWGWQLGREGSEVRIGVVEDGEGGGEDGGRGDAGDGAPKWEKGHWPGAKVYVVPSTSGLVTIPYATKLEIWRGVGEWVCKRREAKGFICS